MNSRKVGGVSSGSFREGVMPSPPAVPLLLPYETGLAAGTEAPPPAGGAGETSAQRAGVPGRRGAPRSRAGLPQSRTSCRAGLPALPAAAFFLEGEREESRSDRLAGRRGAGDCHLREPHGHGQPSLSRGACVHSRQVLSGMGAGVG